MKHLLLAIAIVTCAGCSSKLDRKAALELLTHPSRGVIAGIELGDALDDIARHPPPGLSDGKDLFTDRGERYGHMLYASDINKLSIELSVDPGDPNKKVTGIHVHIRGDDHDAALSGLMDDLEAFYEQQRGKPSLISQDRTEIIFHAAHKRTVYIRIALLDGLTTLDVSTGTANTFTDPED